VGCCSLPEDDLQDTVPHLDLGLDCGRLKPPVLTPKTTNNSETLRQITFKATPIMFDTVLYTAEVVNTPSKVALDLGRAREKLTSIAVRPIEREAHTVLETIRLRDEARRREILERPGCSPCDRPAMDPIYFQTYQYYQARQKEVSDPTTLIVVDEADRLQMNSLEQVRSVFDSGDMGMISMPARHSINKDRERGWLAQNWNRSSRALA
jgi:hypothetical protein